MKNFPVASISLVGLLALVGCADNSQSQNTASTSSVTMSGDSKNMTGNTVTQEAPPPPDNSSSTTTTTSTTAGYPAIHSNGQGY
jgi:hypothetical protein